MNIRDMRREATRLGIKNSSKMKKADLEPLVDAALIAKAEAEVHTEEPVLRSEPHTVSEPDNLDSGLDSVVNRLKPGSPEDTGFYLGLLTKSEARKVRKALRAAGCVSHAAAHRVARRAAA